MTEASAGEDRKETRLQYWMLGGFLAGLVLGLIVHSVAADAAWVALVTTYVTQPIGQIFLRLLFMLIIPLLVSALIVGVADMGEARHLKTVGLRTLLYTVVVSSISVAISLALVNLLQPGGGIDPALARSMIAQSSEGAASIVAQAGESKTGVEAVLAIVPTNFVAAMSANDILAVMFFALFFGVGFLLVDPAKTATIKAGFEGIFEVSMRLIGLVIKLAPIAIFCFMFNLAALFGWELIGRLSAFVFVVLLALGLQMFGVFPLILKFIAGKNPIAFFRETQEASVMAFATASSNATLPTSLRVAEEGLKLPRPISRFVLTIGATANQNGSAMFEGVTVLFLAQFFGVDLSLGQQLVVMLICIMGGIGTAGVPAGTLPVIALILASVGVPPAGIGLVLGVDRFLDMCRTTVNVVGDLVAAQVIASTSRDELPREPADIVIH
ncbi:DAACS family dicarboxylate/amino acid:cation (Na+ or H+) symporter [Sphingobium sp. B1D7B]|uniref:dicarboxylate/amino acid:cation symporter n=1 Tax=unclassified Sphingobium TaxID=2611147 RepID=UPI002225B17B|nr:MULTISPECIES: dicarboxylate/amino acid:cation symporter [unclassified Sphingobium]MCW2392583.1 DAACS family dicarboxylate/amino acid:cation (Na+ or H+) symporter [Sphingobium sp. B11D3A]MCW2404278.1 DAACS family dicarboxylate/amino acid:cation (Na+ or H+) symporter [Sphingobium sp. B1D7B]